MGVAKHLHFDMPGRGDVFLDQHMRVAKGFARLALATDQAFREIFGAFDAPHPLAAAAGHRLDQHRPTDFGGAGGQKAGSLLIAHIAGGDGDARRRHQRLCRILEAHRGDAGRAGADPDQPGIDHALCKCGVFRQEAIARMDRLGAGFAGGDDDLVAHQIAFARG